MGIMNPLEHVDPWLDDEIAAAAKAVVATGKPPGVETDRYNLAAAVSGELEQLELAWQQLQRAESEWRDQFHPQTVFTRGMVKIRNERVDLTATRLMYKRALRILRMSQERKRLRNALFDAAVEAHCGGYDPVSMLALSEAAAVWVSAERQGVAA